MSLTHAHAQKVNRRQKFSGCKKLDFLLEESNIFPAKVLESVRKVLVVTYIVICLLKKHIVAQTSCSKYQLVIQTLAPATRHPLAPLSS